MPVIPAFGRPRQEFKVSLGYMGGGRNPKTSFFFLISFLNWYVMMHVFSLRAWQYLATFCARIASLLHTLPQALLCLLCRMHLFHACLFLCLGSEQQAYLLRISSGSVVCFSICFSLAISNEKKQSCLWVFCQLLTLCQDSTGLLPISPAFEWMILSSGCFCIAELIHVWFPQNHKLPTGWTYACYVCPFPRLVSSARYQVVGYGLVSLKMNVLPHFSYLGRTVVWNCVNCVCSLIPGGLVTDSTYSTAQG